MDFALNKEQEELRKSAVRFAEQRLRNDVVASDRENLFPREAWKECSEFGAQGACIDKKYGGLGLDFISGVLILEGLGAGCRDNGLLFSLNAHIWGS
jgi:alkylation response protein AidB-like acyl-CoA dehydrogenase